MIRVKTNLRGFRSGPEKRGEEGAHYHFLHKVELIQIWRSGVLAGGDRVPGRVFKPRDILENDRSRAAMMFR